MHGIDFDFSPQNLFLSGEILLLPAWPSPLPSSPLPCLCLLSSCLRIKSLCLLLCKETELSTTLLDGPAFRLPCCLLSWSVCERVSSSSRGSVFLSGAFLVPLLLLDSICVCLSSHLSHLHPAPPLPDPSLLFWMPRVWQGRVGRASVPRPWLLLQLLPSLLPKKFLETESPSLHPRRPQRAPGSGTRRMELSPGQLSH